MENKAKQVVVVGSGSAAFAAALAAKEAGLEPLMVESTTRLGGSSAMSGGGLWIPNNPLMLRAGVPDSYENARKYLDRVIGDVGPASSPERREAFLRGGPRLVEWLSSLGFRFWYAPGYADYYPELPGGSVQGRCVEPDFFDLKKLGPWKDKLNIVMPLPLHTLDASQLSLSMRTFSAFLHTANVIGVRAVGSSLLGKKLAKLSDCVFIGESIAGGTTTALAVLRAMGYSANVSSSFASNPRELKQRVVEEAMNRAGIAEGSLKNDPLRAVAELGDPMMPSALGLMRGLKGCKVVLAGGTQMAAVLALGKSLQIDGDISIATTKYIVEDKTASFQEIVESADKPYYYVDPGLEMSKIPPVQIYAQGYVKEGVGMGGAALLAGIYGVSRERLVEETDRVLMTVELPKK